jgi:RNA polymerase sigma-70 factor (ECF subfamily)
MAPSRLKATDRDGPGGHPNDAELVERACAGDRSAEAAIYQRYAGYLSGMVLRLVGSATEAEDILHDTFVLALEELPRLRAGTALRPWLARIAVTQTHRRFRRRRLLRLLGMDRGEAVPFDAIASADAGPEVRAQLAALGRALAELPSDQRIAWSLRYVEGATLEEVADACACSLATAKRRVKAASADLHERVHLADAVVALPRAGERSTKGAS